jgi:hypothetical protein
MAKARSGGGITSSKLVRAKAPKAEPRSRAMSPGGVSQMGTAVDPRSVTPLVSGRGYQPKGPTSNMGQGPGANRVVMRSGSQSLHGPVTPGEVRSPRPGGRDTLSEYGPDKRGMVPLKGRT